MQIVLNSLSFALCASLSLALSFFLLRPFVVSVFIDLLKFILDLSSFLFPLSQNNDDVKIAREKKYTGEMLMVSRKNRTWRHFDTFFAFIVCV